MEPGPSSIIYRQRFAAIDRPELARFAGRLSRVAAAGRSFECLISDDQELRLLNRRFRRKNQPTDVLSFPSEGGSFLGAIAISYDRARAQALAFHHRIETEVRILMLHGVLHLTGMDHETDSGEMAQEEIRLRGKFGLPAGLIARAAQ